MCKFNFKPFFFKLFAFFISLFEKNKFSDDFNMCLIVLDVDDSMRRKQDCGLPRQEK